jgi:type IX secretion system PorP/SprF family membrane protein
MKKIRLTFGLIAVAASLTAQDYHYSMFTMSPLNLNPALTGNFTGDLRIINNYRMQWSTISKPYSTYSFGGDMPLMRKDKKKGSPDFFAVGLNVNVDKAGSSSLKNNTYGGSFSYNKSLDGVGKTYFSLGGSFAFAQRSITLSGMSWGTQWTGLTYDPTIANGESIGFGDSYTYFDFAGGVAVTSAPSDRFKMSGGVAAFHLNRPRIDFLGGTDKLYMKVGIHWKGEIALGANSNALLVPQAQYVMQGPARMLNAGLGVKFKLQEASRYTGYQSERSLTLGGMYRAGDAVSGYLRIDIASVGVAFNYDLNVSKLTPASNGVGAFEFMLIYTGMYSNRNSRNDNKSFF